MSQNTIGDLKNNYEKLRKNLLKIKYPQLPSNSEYFGLIFYNINYFQIIQRKPRNISSNIELLFC